MATASELKGKVTKILTIVEYLEDENINDIEKDILLQAVRDLYTDILVTKTEIPESENKVSAEENEPDENVVEIPVENEETPSEPPVVAIPFDAGEFDFHDLFGMNSEEENVEEDVVEEQPQEEIAEEAEDNVADEPVEVKDFADEATEEQKASVEELDETQEEVPEEMEDSEEVAEAQEEPVDEVPAEEPKFENEYFSQNESVSSDFDATDSKMEESVEEEHPEEILEPTMEEELVAEEIAEPVTESAIEEQPEENYEPSVEEEFAAEVLSKEIPEQFEEPATEEQSEEVCEPLVETETVDDVAVEEPAIEEKPVEVEPEVVPEPTVTEEPVIPAEPIHQEPEPEKVITLGEQLGQSRQESLNDRFANNVSADLSSRIGLKPITDILSSIGLGDRYRFTRMLFAGNGGAFNETVAKLNQMSSMEEAEGYVRASFNWDMESPIVADFMNIVRRRYM